MGRVGGLLREVLTSFLPIVGMLLLFQFAILRRPLAQWREIMVGLGLTVLGLMAMLHGLRLGLLPLGESVAAALIAARNVPLILGFALLLGVTATLAEPALLTMANQVEDLSSGALGRSVFLYTVACGVGFGTMVGTTRILFGIEATPYFIPALAAVLVLTYFAPERYTALAFDAALATTGPVTVTLVIALGTGLAAALGRNDTLLYGFGLVTMAALGPITAVLSLGILLNLLGR